MFKNPVHFISVLSRETNAFKSAIRASFSFSRLLKRDTISSCAFTIRFNFFLLFAICCNVLRFKLIQFCNIAIQYLGDGRLMYIGDSGDLHQPVVKCHGGNSASRCYLVANFYLMFVFTAQTHVNLPKSFIFHCYNWFYS